MKVYIETLGCPKNQNDSRRAAGYLTQSGKRITSNPCEADCIIVNTCGFIDDAKRESIDKIFEMSNIKKRDGKLIVSGCLSQRYSDELYEEIPEVDCFIGVNEYKDISSIIDSLFDNNKRIVKTDSEEDNFEDEIQNVILDNPHTATLKIGEGCDNYCTYCIIPKIRGRYRSKPMEQVVEEAKKLAVAGIKELILIAQDLTYYGKDLYGDFTLPTLLRQLCKIEGLKWIRLMYCYEDKITDELIEVMAQEDKICKYIDIPLQHTSDGILKKMNRKSTCASIEELIKKLRSKIKDLTIRTTFIVGFPGETDEDFENLYNMVGKLKFDRMGVFKYSREEGTAAATMQAQVDEEVKDERWDALMRKQLEISSALNNKKVGEVFDVLIEEMDEDGSYIGRSEHDAPEIDNSVIFQSKVKHNIGDMVKVVIKDAFDYDLVGEEIFEE